MKNRKVLIIDDDQELCRILEFTFSMEGARVFLANDGKEGLQKLYAHRPDLVILDVRMPELNGWEVCRQIRNMSDVPIIMLTTAKSDKEVIQGLDVGADDFLVKPFNRDVLLARSRAVMRRMEKQTLPGQDGVYSDGYLSINLERHEVLVEGQPIKLTPTEFDMLSFFYKNAGRTLTYEQILQNVWGWEYQDSVDYVQVYLSHLRRKLEKDSRSPSYFTTIHGVGYRFNKRV